MSIIVHCWNQIWSLHLLNIAVLNLIIILASRLWNSRKLAFKMIVFDELY